MGYEPAIVAAGSGCRGPPSGRRGIEKPPNALRDPFALDAGAETDHIRRGHAAGVAPIARRLAEAAAQERSLDATVNAAYGLSAGDVALPWRTAPPRMPLPPPAA